MPYYVSEVNMKLNTNKKEKKMFRIEVEHKEEAGSIREYVIIHFEDEEYPTIQEEEEFLKQSGRGRDLQLGYLKRLGIEGVNRVVYEGQLNDEL